MSNPATGERDSAELLTVPQACRLLAISRGTLYNLFASGAVPRIKIGKAVRVSHSDLLALLKRSEA